MSGLRILGVAIGTIGIVLTFLYYRGIKWKRNNFILFFLFNALLIVISISPETINVLRNMLALKSSERGRILSLLVLSVIFLVFLVFYLKSKLDLHTFQFDKLVRALGRQPVLLEKIKHKIKSTMILIPAYNEAENLEELLPKIISKIDTEKMGILVIDDSSSDGTGEVAEGFGCLVVQNLINRGGGAALRLGFDILMHHAVDTCITMDADNQHEPGDIPHLLEPLLNNQADIVIGSRQLGKDFSKSRLRQVGLGLFNFIISRLLKQEITDCSSGFRAFNVRVLHSVKLKETQYHTSELIIEAVKKGCKIKEVPITIRERKYGQSKKGSNFKYGLNFAKVILKTWWRK